MKILSGGEGAETGCSHSGFRFPKHGERNSDTSNTRERNSDTSSENWKNQASEKLEPVWRLIPQLSILWCGRIGAEKCSIGGLSFQFWLRFHTSPIHPNFQWRSNCTQLDPVFVANVREIMKSPLAQTLSRKVDQFLWDAKAVITRFWRNGFCTVECPLPPAFLPAAGPRENERKSHFFWVARASASCVRGGKATICLTRNVRRYLRLQVLAGIEVSQVTCLDLCVVVRHSPPSVGSIPDKYLPRSFL